MERKYEVMFILRPDVVGEEADKLIAGFEATITKGNGKLVSSEKLGNRKLAYTVRKFNEGNYNLLTVEADGSLVAELERRLRVTEPVIKFITVRMDEEEKRINKIKKLRSTKIKQSTVNAQAAHAAQANAAASASQAAAAQATAPAPSAPQRSVEPAAETAAVPEAIA
ncbi:MAG TPA: 30S ribosomal protein S6 [Acidobacteriaceae bacterium]|nr:30S ribosomal protein S6 [Acidobacteriaceae bacterium]